MVVSYSCSQFVEGRPEEVLAYFCDPRHNAENHPLIMKVEDVGLGTTDDGWPYRDLEFTDRVRVCCCYNVVKYRARM
eukprot:gene16351-49181_t